MKKIRLNKEQYEDFIKEQAILHRNDNIGISGEKNDFGKAFVFYFFPHCTYSSDPEGLLQKISESSDIDAKKLIRENFIIRDNVPKKDVNPIHNGLSWTK